MHHLHYRQYDVKESCKHLISFFIPKKGGHMTRSKVVGESFLFFQGTPDLMTCVSNFFECAHAP